MTTVIHAEGLGKRYRRGVRVEAGLRHVLEEFARSPWRALRGARPEMIWALKDVSLEVKEGEALGVIGRHGAGRTTLLKILRRITAPAEAWAEIRGKVRSLLEVGTGFHPELTGRENTYLSGSILGMSKREIDRKFDEIVAYAEIEKFIETPVKHYSSGMYVRLAFSVAAHLEPEILLVDEVLAVGDAELQRRCLGRVEELSSHGRTVLFVSHQMQVLARLCDRAILLREGRIVQDGPSEQVVAHYLQAEGGAGSQRSWPDLASAPGGKRVRIREVRVIDEHGHLADSVDIRRPVGIEISFTVLRDDVPVFPKIKLVDREGNNAFNTVDTSPLWNGRPVPGDYVATAWIPGNLLNEGFYTVEPGISSVGALGTNKLVHQARAPEAVAFHVYDPGEGDTSKGRFAGQFRGAVR